MKIEVIIGEKLDMIKFIYIRFAFKPFMNTLELATLFLMLPFSIP